MQLFYSITALLLVSASAFSNLRGRKLAYECNIELSRNAESGACGDSGATFPICKRSGKTACVNQNSWNNHNLMGATCGACEGETFENGKAGEQGLAAGANIPMSFEKHDFNAPMCNVTYNATDIEFTLVTQLLENRLWMMEEQCRRWGEHPMSIAVGTDDGDDEDILEALENMGCNPEYVNVTIIDDIEEHESPANALRNAAMEQVNTTHAFYVDADFMVSPNLYEHLSNFSQNLTDRMLTLIIPAFELRGVCDDGNAKCKKENFTELPEDGDELIELLARNETIEPTIVPLKNKNAKSAPEFLSSQEEAQISCISGSDKFEPYLVFRYCKDIPSFQETLTGYGNNKVAWTQQIRSMGYQMTQLGTESFAVHFPNKVHKFETRTMDVLEKQRLRLARENWKTYLKTSVGADPSVPLFSLNPGAAGGQGPEGHHAASAGEGTNATAPLNIIPSCQAIAAPPNATAIASAMRKY